MKSRQNSISSFLTLALCFLLCQPPTVTPANAQSAEAVNVTSAAIPPDTLYERVWDIVKEQFYDSTFNDQDWSRWHHRYDHKLKTSDDAYKAIETMLASLGDRYTRFLDKKSFEDETSQISARLYGIGIQMGLDRTQKVIVIAPIEGTPAAEAGLLPGDEIAEVDGKMTKGLTLTEVSRLIRGPIGTTVIISINRAKQKLQFKIRRAEIAIKSVQTVRMLTPDIGYIRLSTFMSQLAAQEMREALSRLTPARGIILDLRGNPGGLVNNAVDICSMFMGGGVIVSTVAKDGQSSSARASGTPICRLPLVVLIDAGSASASEITSGALKDSGRAKLVGQKSFGKGLVQSVRRLDDGSGINVTIARYVTPNNIDINKKGIVPEFTVELKAEDYEKNRGPWWIDLNPAEGKKHNPEDLQDIQLKKAVEVLQDELKNPAAPPSYQLKLDLPSL